MRTISVRLDDTSEAGIMPPCSSRNCGSNRSTGGHEPGVAGGDRPWMRQYINLPMDLAVSSLLRLAPHRHNRPLPTLYPPDLSAYCLH